MNRLALLIAGLGLAMATAAAANDSSAEMAAGGLVLRQSRDIDMISEDLFISRERVRVRYVFRNRSRRPVTTIVAFPMPDRELSVEMEGDTSAVTDFQTNVDGRPVTMRVEYRAMLGGVDHSATLRRLGIPILPTANQTVSSIVAAIARLPRAERERLARIGLIHGPSYHDSSHQIVPSWTGRETWYWEQSFAPGRDLLVNHSYSPGVGGSGGVALTFPEYRANENGRADIARYCADADFLASLDRMAAREARGELDGVAEHRLSYILATGGNWRAPIGDFRMVIDKGRADAIVSFCAEGVRRISPTQFEVRHRNWRPTRDVHILIVGPEAME